MYTKENIKVEALTSNLLIQNFLKQLTGHKIIWVKKINSGN